MVLKIMAFNNGIIIGRFQPFHNGHLSMIMKALSICDHVWILVGSSQEYGTLKNPYSYSFRKECIESATSVTSVIAKRISIMPLPDAGVGDGPEWGDYVMKHFMQQSNVIPDIIITAQENVRTNWFNNYVDRIALLALPKQDNIHATDIRKFLIEDNFPEFAMRTPIQLWEKYPIMRKEILSIENK